MLRYRLPVLSVLVSAAFYVLMARLQDVVFPHVQFTPGIGWIYLPAGARLLCPLLFGAWGAAGLMAGSWLICYFYLFPDDLLRCFTGALSSALAPYVVYRLALWRFGMAASLTNLSPRRLLTLVPMFGVASPLFHHLWFWLHGDHVNLVSGFLVMAIGDMLGALVVIYTLKLLLALLPRGLGAPAGRHDVLNKESHGA